MKTIEAVPACKPRRKILGMSAILLPFVEEQTATTAAMSGSLSGSLSGSQAGQPSLDMSKQIDWEGFRGHVQRTLDAGLIPAVNMDTGYTNLIDDAVRQQVLRETQQLCSGRRFVAGAFVADHPGSPFNSDAYRQQIDAVQTQAGIPVIFQSHGLSELDDHAVVRAYQDLGAGTEQFVAFELGAMFAPFGKIYSEEVYAELVRIPQCLGAKHSSLNRQLEWQRLAIRDAIRPDFHVLTGNDLAIDMVMYGSDYLLGLSTLAPDLFALRDRYWLDGDTRFFELNDWLQYLGFFAFRAPVPAYKHTAAQFLKLRGWIASDRTHPRSPSRPASDCDILANWLENSGFCPQ